MKKIILPIIIILGLIGGIWYVKKDKIVPVETTTSQYRNVNSGISFTYPRILQAKTENGIATLHHEVPFEHHDYCDFKGEATTTIPTLTDFHVKFFIVNKNLVDTMKTESPYIPQENFVNGEVVESPGFIDLYYINDLKGYKIFEGAEGCGRTIFYFPISSEKTLVVTDEFITVFSGAIDVGNMEAALLVPGVINREKATETFESILKTVKVQ